MGVALTTYEVLDERAKMLSVLLDVFGEVGAEHCLIGGIAAGYYGPERATVDVDVLVPRSKSRAIATAIEARGFVVTEHKGMRRVYSPDATPGRDAAIADLIEREANPTLRAAAHAVETATVLGHEIAIVKRGALVALKFQAAVSPDRPIGDRYIDVGDMSRVLRTKFDAEDEALALSIADTMYPGARDELAQMIDDLRNDRRVKI